MIRAHFQRGITLLLMLLLLLLSTGVFMTEFLSTREFEKQKQLRTQNALDDAREALIAYAVSDEDRPGELPCPDIDNDGKITAADGVAGNCASLRGWLPWFLLGLGDIRDGEGERLWYAIDDSFRPYGRVPPGTPLNPDTKTGIVINNINPAVPYVAAVILSPGQSLPSNGMNRTDRKLVGRTADNLVSSYLEDSNSDADKTTYTRRAAMNGFNDTAVIITVDEIMQHVKARVKQTVVNKLNSYYEDPDGNPSTSPKYYPYAEPRPGRICDGTSTLSAGYLQFIVTGEAAKPACQYPKVLEMPAWFRENDWHRMFWYAFDPSCGYAGGSCMGNIIVGTALGIKSLILFADKSLDIAPCGGNSQPYGRPSDNPCDYFDSPENHDSDEVFETPADSATSNDQLIILN